MSRYILFIVPLLLICATAFSDNGAAAGQTQPTTAQAAQVTIDNFAFVPATITITAGQTVTWINRDDVPHTATSEEKPREFDSKALDTDEQYSHTFNTPGTYKYFCKVHTHMTGTVIVKAGP